jgi:hypothetical protein
MLGANTTTVWWLIYAVCYPAGCIGHGDGPFKAQTACMQASGGIGGVELYMVRNVKCHEVSADEAPPWPGFECQILDPHHIQPLPIGPVGAHWYCRAK